MNFPLPLSDNINFVRKLVSRFAQKDERKSEKHFVVLDIRNNSKNFTFLPFSRIYFSRVIKVCFLPQAQIHCRADTAGREILNIEHSVDFPGFVHFFRPKVQGLFKDFPGPYFEISRTFLI